MEKLYQAFIASFVSALIFIGMTGSAGISETYAATNTKSLVVEGTKYYFEGNSDYELSSPEEVCKTSKGETYGTLEVTGAITSQTEKGGIPSFGIDGGTITFTYKYSDKLLKAPEDQIHLVDDKGIFVDDIALDDLILKGALIVQTSKDGRIWYTISNQKKTNIFAEKPINQSDPFYEATEIQLVNGCYYRVIIAYKTAIKTGASQFLLWENGKYKYQKVAEVYNFYAFDNTAVSMIPPSEKNRKPLGSKVRTEKYEGYQGAKEMNNEDPHFGWDVGQFYIGGYTDWVNYQGTPTFLKNNGDRISLWFDLLQDIDKCSGNPKVHIIPDNKGSDAYFEIPGGVNETMDFGHGALIVRHITEESKNKPQVYTDFLRATASVDADTKISLFEEGDYEVALDYAVKFDKTELFGMSVLPETAHYRIFFNFSVRNSNTIVFLFDTATGSELSNGAITENGFRLDFAKSKYLKVNVRREILKDGFGGLSEDTRFNGSATDGQEFTDEGIYTVTVTNQYTNSEPTVKRVYVGKNNVLKAYMVTGLSIAEINDKVALGATIMDDGTIVEPEPESESEKETEPKSEALPLEEQFSKAEKENIQHHETGNSKASTTFMPTVVFSLILVGGAYFYLKRRSLRASIVKKKESTENLINTSETNTITDLDDLHSKGNEEGGK